MTRGPDKQFDREQALDKAMEVFWAQGYEATGVTELLQEMGIGRQSMYDTFGNKRSLFQEALRRYADEYAGRMITILEAPGSPLGNIDNLFDFWQEMLRERGACGCLMGNTAAELGPHDPEMAAALRFGFERLEQALANTFRRAQAEGELAVDLDADALASLLVVTGQGTALVSKLHGDPRLARRVLSGFRSLLVRK